MLLLQPISIREASAFVLLHHRHHRPPRGGLAAIGCSDGTALIGAAILGRPVARLLQDGATCEVLRLCAAEGSPRGTCSWLLARCRRLASCLGYRRILTYTLEAEGGASLRGAGWQPVATVRPEPRGWDKPGRPRAVTACHDQTKTRWEAPCA